MQRIPNPIPFQAAVGKGGSISNCNPFHVHWFHVQLLGRAVYGEPQYLVDAFFLIL
jgi:hypothetical protein